MVGDGDVGCVLVSASCMDQISREVDAVGVATSFSGIKNGIAAHINHGACDQVIGRREAVPEFIDDLEVLRRSIAPVRYADLAFDISLLRTVFLDHGDGVLCRSCVTAEEVQGARSYGLFKALVVRPVPGARSRLGSGECGACLPLNPHIICIVSVRGGLSSKLA